MNTRTTTLVLSLGLFAAGAFAHTGAIPPDASRPRHDYSKAGEKAFGKAVDPRAARRTIAVDMGDRMRFSPAKITVKRGDSVRFVVTNSGKLVHEMVLGTLKELEEHAELMKKHPDMEHDEPHMVHVEPGRREEMGWQFTKAGEFYYGCLVPGHFEAGMMGKVVVK